MKIKLYIDDTYLSQRKQQKTRTQSGVVHLVIERSIHDCQSIFQNP